MGIASVIVSLLIATQLKLRMVPFADRDQFAVEIYLRPDVPLERTAAVADSVYRVLHDDARVKSVTSFVGCSSPRFQMSYAPQMAGKNYAQFIVNTTSVDDTEDILDQYADAWADRFPEAYVKFKQLDYQNVPSLEFRFYGSDIDSLRAAADGLMARMRPDARAANGYTPTTKTPVRSSTCGWIPSRHRSWVSRGRWPRSTWRWLRAMSLSDRSGKAITGCPSCSRTTHGRANARSPASGTPTSRRRCLRSAYPCARSPTWSPSGARARSYTATACAA